MAIPVIAWATSLNRITVAPAAIATALRSVAPAIANDSS